MQNSRLISVLKTFSETEFKGFEKFTASPYFSRGRNLLPLLKALKKYYPLFSSKKFTKENIMIALSKKNRKATESLLKMQMSELYKMTEEYLTIEGFKTRKGLKEYFFINQCRRRGLTGIAEARTFKEIEEINNSGIDRWHYMYYLFTASEKINLAFGRDNPGLVFEDSRKVSEAVLHQFLCTSSRNIFNINAMKIFHNNETEGNLLLDFFRDPRPGTLAEKLNYRDEKSSRASRIYMLSILTDLEPENEEHYFRLKEAVLKEIGIFTIPERFFLLHSLIVKAIYYMDTRDYTKFARVAFGIINFRLEQKLYKETPQGFYTSVEFFVSLKIGFILNETDWIREYTSAHIDEVPAEHRKETEQLAGAFLKFSLGDHSGSLELASQISGLPFVLIYELKCLQLMAQYELNMASEAFYLLEAFKVYLRKNKNVSVYFKENNLNFIKYYTLITKYRLNETTPELEQVRDEIKNSNTGYKNWLLKKIDEMV